MLAAVGFVASRSTPIVRQSGYGRIVCLEIVLARLDRLTVITEVIVKSYPEAVGVRVEVFPF